MVSNIQIQDWTKERLDEVREAESHTSHDSTIKALLRDRALVREVLSNNSQLKSPSASATASLADGGERIDLPEPTSADRIAFAIGTTGKGKSVTFAYQAHRLLENDDNAVVVLDTTGSYSGLCEKHDGQRIDLATSTNKSLNPLDIQRPGQFGDEELSSVPAENYQQKLADVRTFFEIALARSGDYTTSLSRVLQLAARVAYREAGITEDPSTHGRQAPTVRDLDDVLVDMRDEPGNYGTSDAEQAQIADDAVTARGFIKQFRPGEVYAAFGGQSSVALNETGLTQIILPSGYDGLSAPRVAALVSSLSQQAAMQSRDLTLILDEAHQFLKHEAAANSILRRTRHTRATHGLRFAFWAVIQDPDVLATSDSGSTLLETADRLYLHGLSWRVDRLKRQFDLSDEQARYVQSAAHGTEESGPQVLVRDDQREWAPYRVEIPEDVLASITTYPVPSTESGDDD